MDLKGKKASECSLKCSSSEQVQRWARLRKVTDFRFPQKAGNFLTSWATIKSSRRHCSMEFTYIILSSG